MRLPDLRDLQRSCAVILNAAGQVAGTGYLISGDLLVTCAHVVAARGPTGTLSIRFPSGQVDGSVWRVDTEADCALVTLPAIVPDTRPLSLLTEVPASARFVIAGFPRPGMEETLLLQGEIEVPEGEDDLHNPALILSCVDASAFGALGMAAPLRALSGSPVIVDGLVAGHLTRYAPDRLVLGELYACPARPVAVLAGRGVTRDLLPPGGAYEPRLYVHRPREERSALRVLSRPGRPLLLVGPQRFGKSWLLRHLMERQAESVRSVIVNLEALPEPTLGSLDTLLFEIGAQLCGRERAASAWRRAGSSMHRLTYLVREELRKGPLWLALDRLDDVLSGSPYLEELLGFLRSLAERREPPFPHLRHVLLLKTTAVVAPVGNYSPLANVAEVLRMGEMDVDEVKEMAARYRLDASDEEVSSLRALVGGHPYLCGLAMYAAARTGAPLREVINSPRSTEQAFAQSLSPLRERLRRTPQLLEWLRRVARDPSAAIDRGAADRLLRAGLFLEDEDGAGQIRLRPLYRRLVS